MVGIANGKWRSGNLMANKKCRYHSYRHKLSKLGNVADGGISLLMANIHIQTF